MQRDRKKLQPIHIAIGERLRELRIAAGYSSYETFAFMHDISRSNYSRYENGHNMQLDTFIYLLTCLDISFADFFKDFDAAPSGIYPVIAPPPSRV